MSLPLRGLICSYLSITYKLRAAYQIVRIIFIVYPGAPVAQWVKRSLISRSQARAPPEAVIFSNANGIPFAHSLSLSLGHRPDMT